MYLLNKQQHIQDLQKKILESDQHSYQPFVNKQYNNKHLKLDEETKNRFEQLYENHHQINKKKEELKNQLLK